jgi:hypothetical protein
MVAQVKECVDVGTEEAPLFRIACQYVGPAEFSPPAPEQQAAPA